MFPPTFYGNQAELYVMIPQKFLFEKLEWQDFGARSKYTPDKIGVLNLLSAKTLSFLLFGFPRAWVDVFIF